MEEGDRKAIVREGDVTMGEGLNLPLPSLRMEGATSQRMCQKPLEAGKAKKSISL